MAKNRNEIINRNVEQCRKQNIIIPTYKQMRSPETIPEGIKDELKNIGLWDLNSRNLFRITWKNEPVEFGGGFGDVNYIELSKEFTGVKCRIFILLGKFFPTGAHKVGATFGPLVEKLVSGDFDISTQKALWPSTGNYCRGGVYNSHLLGCHAIAVLPEGMSRERFDWLNKLGAEVIATPGSESNVKEIFDKVIELEKNRGDQIVNLNQFAEIGNSLWHYAITGTAIEEVFNKEAKNSQKLTGIFLTQGSAGTLGCGDYLRTKFNNIVVGAGEALQCPTLINNGFGEHRIEGIGDKHVPWIFNIKNTDFVAAIDDNLVISIMRLFNEKNGHDVLIQAGINQQLIDKLHLFGISSIANIIGAIKMAKYYEMDEDDVIFTVATDSMQMYQSRLNEENTKHGYYTEKSANIDFFGKWHSIAFDNALELSYYDKKRIHNLKYFTWIEQLGKDIKELRAQWYDKNYWSNQFKLADIWDQKIIEFNNKTGLLKKYS